MDGNNAVVYFVSSVIILILGGIGKGIYDWWNRKRELNNAYREVISKLLRVLFEFQRKKYSGVGNIQDAIPAFASIPLEELEKVYEPMMEEIDEELNEAIDDFYVSLEEIASISPADYVNLSSLEFVLRTHDWETMVNITEEEEKSFPKKIISNAMIKTLEPYVKEIILDLAGKIGRRLKQSLTKQLEYLLSEEYVEGNSEFRDRLFKNFIIEVKEQTGKDISSIFTPPAP